MLQFPYFPKLQKMEHSKKQKTMIPVSKFQKIDNRNFIKACNQVCYFETPDLEVYFSIFDIGFFFKQYAIVALKVKKGLNLYELAFADHLESADTLLPLKALPTFSQIRRFNENHSFIYRKRQIRVRFEDGESWKLLFKNKDVALNWMDLLELVIKNQHPFAFQKSLLVKELKRNYEYMSWRLNNPMAKSNIFGSLIKCSSNFKKQIQNIKRLIGVNSNELIGRYIFEKRDKQLMKKRMQQIQRQELIYENALLSINDDKIPIDNEA